MRSNNAKFSLYTTLLMVTCELSIVAYDISQKFYYSAGFIGLCTLAIAYFGYRGYQSGKELDAISGKMEALHEDWRKQWADRLRQSNGTPSA